MYIPLGGSQNGKLKSIRNVFIIFTVSGFWHGANWTFIFWGLFHSILFVPSLIFKTNRKYTTTIIGENTFLPSLKEVLQALTTFLLVTIGWVFFRSETIMNSLDYLNKMIFLLDKPNNYLFGLNFIVIIVLTDYIFRKNERDIMNYKSIFVRWVLYISFLISLIFLGKYGIGQVKEFIYFQF